MSALLPDPERVISLSNAPRDIELPSEVRGLGGGCSRTPGGSTIRFGCLFPIPRG